jgi:hypothetical protein
MQSGDLSIPHGGVSVILIIMPPYADINPDAPSSCSNRLNIAFQADPINDRYPNHQQFKNPSIHEN